MSRRPALIAAAVLLGGLLFAATVPASAVNAATSARYVVYTGYGDCPSATGCNATTITNPKFPFPWYGASNVVFEADPNVVNPMNDTDPDTSAIRIDNPGKSSITVNDVSVTGCGSGTLDLWGSAPYAYPYTVPSHSTMVFSSTNGDNFDGSDTCSPDPTVTVTVNGVATTYHDDVANSGRGAIPGFPGSDESTPWTKIGGKKVKIVVLPSSLPVATVNTSYGVQLVAQDSNGDPTFTSGKLPAGLTLSSSGDLSGTPTKSGTFTIKVKVSDTAMPVDTGKASYSLTVS